jgi:tetratricopeptide (TPR) repeat protein
LLLALWGAGCGSPTLHSRYQAERDFWHAQRRLSRIQINPRLTQESDYREVERAFTELLRHYPASEWATPERMADPYGRDVAALTGRSTLALARLAEMRGRDSVALGDYRSIRADFAAVVPVALEAALGEARVLEQMGREGEAAARWAAVAAEFPFADPWNHQPIEAVMDAPLRAAEYLQRSGRPAEADSVVRAALQRYRSALPAARGTELGLLLLLRVATAEKGLGRAESAADALRETLFEPGMERQGHQRVAALAELWLEAGRPDSVLAYATWLAQEWPQRAGGQALMLRARALEALGLEDQALHAYQEFLDRYSQREDAGAYALMRRGRILEARGSWELARSEYRSLVARYPATDAAMEGLLRVCSHDLAEGDSAAARAEARRSIEQLEGLVTQYRDSGVEMLARRTQADLYLLVGDWRSGYQVLNLLWSRYRSTPLGEAAAFRAARLAEHEMRNREEARRLYADLAERAPSERGRAVARAEADRLQRGERG